MVAKAVESRELQIGRYLNVVSFPLGCNLGRQLPLREGCWIDRQLLELVLFWQMVHEQHVRWGNARLCAFDLTLSAPKSVSLVWALGDPDTANAVVAAHEYAVDQTIGYLEREAVRSGAATTVSKRSRAAV